jgi:histidinol-phosphatase (PHP family)
LLNKNYHTHLYRCKHATGDVPDYCRAALDSGLSVLGISDHAALPDDRWPEIRMDYSELPDYCDSIDNARLEFPELVILKSMECEYDDAYDSHYREVLLGELGFDYLIGAAHLFPHDGEYLWVYGGATTGKRLRSYAEYFIRSMESGLFAFMAHPDLFGCTYLSWDANTEACSREILDAAVDIGMPLEINGYGLQKPKVETPEGIRPMYPWNRFWELAAEYDIEVVVNSDAHKPENVVCGMAEALSIAERYGLPLADLSPVEVGQRC